MSQASLAACRNKATFFYIELTLIEVDVFNHLCTHVFVEATGECSVLHEKVLLDGWRSDLYMKSLVLDEDVLRVALNLGTHDHWPSLNQTVLIVGGLNAVDAHELLDDAVNSFCIAFSHNSNLSTLNSKL